MNNPRLQKLAVCIVLAALIVIVFGQVYRFDYTVYDDHDYIVGNSHVLTGLTADNLKWAYTTGYVSNWHPVTWISHMLDAQLFGPGPRGPHIVNVVFHVVNSILLFLLLSRMTGSVWASAFAAALFAIHPQHTESVAWVAERKDVLSTFFWFLTWAAYLFYVKRPGILRYLLILPPFAVGLMAKPMLVTLPATLLLLDYWPLGRLTEGAKGEKGKRGKGERGKGERGKKGKGEKGGAGSGRTDDIWSRGAWLVLEKMPLFLLVLALSLVTLHVQQGAVKVLSLEARVGNALVSYARYIFMMFWPFKLAAFYPHPEEHVPVGQVLAAVAVLLVISGLVVLGARRHPYLAVGWLWYMGTLVPVIGVVQVGAQALANRYTYVPFIGLFIVLGWGIPELAARVRIPKMALAVAAGIVLALLTGVAHVQAGYWQDSISLFDHTLKVTSENHFAHKYLGTALADGKRHEEAVAQFEEAIRINPNVPDLYTQLGNSLSALDRLDEAVAQYQKAIKRDPRNLAAHYNLANALFRQGKNEEAVIHYKEADPAYNKMLQTEAVDPAVYTNMGNALSGQGKFAEAAEQFTKALKANPGSVDARYYLANALAGQNKFDEAITHYAEILKQQPGHAGAQINMGNALSMLNRPQEALPHYLEANRLQPNDPSTLVNLGNASAQLNQLDDAVGYYQTAIQLDPKHVDARSNLAITLAKQGKLEEAASAFSEVLQINPNNANAQQSLAAVQQEIARRKTAGTP